ncbi:snRNA-activating protein complex subunit 2 [Amblyraja radiata]|uniref:snRNA-activating protein complex subunit 2 n=1 Tax=Amblyraja radiata TaxID=386614 RepID=UPI001402D56F|nr:snRNA-activating protein complex subunit 2 [Amblyraja radiata]
MKPPSRVRAAPQRYSGVPQTGVGDGEDGEAETAEMWSRSEKQQMLRAMGQQSAGRPLDQLALETAVPTRCPQEVLGYVQSLCQRSERSAVQKVYNQRRREHHHRLRQPHVPLQIWTELAEAVTGRLDEVIATAVSQTLLIAATEPVCGDGHCRVPARDGGGHGEGEGRGPGEEAAPSGSGSGPAAEGEPPGSQRQARDTDTDTDTDTECAAVYSFLSAAVRGTPLPPLPPQASSLLLELLHSLPAQVLSLRGRPLSPALQGSQGRLQGLHRLAPPGARPTSPLNPLPRPLNPFTLPLGLLVGGEGDSPAPSPPSPALIL